MVNKYFSIYDYLVLGVVLLLSLFIGLLQSRSIGFKNILKSVKKQLLYKKNRKILEKNTQENIDEIEPIEEKEDSEEDESKMNEYLIASKQVHLVPVAFSILASVFSTNTIIGMPAEVYQYGMQINVRIIPDTIGCILSAYVFLPILGKLNLVTMNEYFHMRFNSRIVRLISIISYCVQLMVWNGIYLYGAGTSLSSVTGISVYWTMAILGLVTTLYTSFGGMRGVIWTDVFQLAFMLIGVVFIIIKGSYDVGGVTKVWKIASDGGRINFFDFRPNPFIRQTFWSIFFGNLITSTVDYNMDQSVIQRYAATETVKQAKYAMIITGIGSILIVVSTGFIGLVIYATYIDCDPLSISNVTKLEDPNQLLAYYTIDKLSSIPGISGFILGSLISAAFSTISSQLNGMVAILWKDCFKKASYFRKLNDSQNLIVAKAVVVVCGVISVVLSFLFCSIGGNLIQFSYILDSAITPSIALLFLMGSCFYFVNSAGAIAGSGVSLIVGLWMLIGEAVVSPQFPTLPLECNNSNISYSNITYSGEAINVSGFDKLYSLSFHLFSVFVNMIGLIVGLIVSLATGGLKNIVRNDLVLFNKKYNIVSTNNIS